MYTCNKINKSLKFCDILKEVASSQNLLRQTPVKGFSAKNNGIKRMCSVLFPSMWLFENTQTVQKNIFLMEHSICFVLFFHGVTIFCDLKNKNKKMNEGSQLCFWFFVSFKKHLYLEKVILMTPATFIIIVTVRISYVHICCNTIQVLHNDTFGQHWP